MRKAESLSFSLQRVRPDKVNVQKYGGPQNFDSILCANPKDSGGEGVVINWSIQSLFVVLKKPRMRLRTVKVK